MKSSDSYALSSSFESHTVFQVYSFYWYDNLYSNTDVLHAAHADIWRYHTLTFEPRCRPWNNWLFYFFCSDIENPPFSHSYFYGFERYGSFSQGWLAFYKNNRNWSSSSFRNEFESMITLSSTCEMTIPSRRLSPRLYRTLILARNQDILGLMQWKST